MKKKPLVSLPRMISTVIPFFKALQQGYQENHSNIFLKK